MATAARLAEAARLFLLALLGPMVARAKRFLPLLQVQAPEALSSSFSMTPDLSPRLKSRAVLRRRRPKVTLRKLVLLLLCLELAFRTHLKLQVPFLALPG